MCSKCFEQVCDQTFTGLECAELEERLKKVSHRERHTIQEWLTIIFADDVSLVADTEPS